MARRRSRNTEDRDTSDIASLLAPPALPLEPLHEVLAPLRELEDLRSYHPEAEHRRPRAADLRSSSDVVLRPRQVTKKTRSNRDVFGFRVPEKVLVCARRQERREVLHALRRTRSGAGARRRRSRYSHLSCRR